MLYLKEYQTQVTAFYKTLNKLIFSRDRDLEGRLGDFVMKPGFLWEFFTAHKWLANSIWGVLRAVIQLVLAYVAVVLLSVMYLVMPVLILLVYPFFSLYRYRTIKAMGAKL